METCSQDDSKLRTDCDVCGSKDRNIDVPGSPAFGITSNELGNYVRRFADYCASRVESDGFKEYDRGTHQAFEEMSLRQLVVGIQEELADTANYLAMISLLIGRLGDTKLFKETA